MMPQLQSAASNKTTLRFKAGGVKALYRSFKRDLDEVGHGEQLDIDPQLLRKNVPEIIFGDLESVNGRPRP